MNPTINDSFGTLPLSQQIMCTISRSACPLALQLGGHSVSDPPDPIPNSAVKPDSADGTIA
jgi:hypothetical protein